MPDVKMITYSTDSGGADLVPNPFLQCNHATTNLLFPSEPPVNTTVTLAANEYTLWIEGTGSITSTYGTATEASPLTFTGNTLAELFTVVGSVDIAQIALGSVKGAYAPTTTAEESIPDNFAVYPAANVDPSNSNLLVRIDWSDEDIGVLDIGVVSLISITAGTLTLSDGTNSLSEVITPGTHDIDILLSATQMSLTVDTGITQTGPYTPVPAGDITVRENHWALRDKIIN